MLPPPPLPAPPPNQVYYVPRLPFTQSDTFPTIFGAFPALRRVILAERISLLHAHQAFSTMAHEAVLHARTMGLRTVFTDHSLFGFADASSILINKVLKFTLADVHRVICVSHTSKENTVLRACIPPARVFVVPNAVDASRFCPGTPNADKSDAVEPTSSANAGSKTPNLTIIVMSRLVYRKGIDLLAAVLPEVCRRHPTTTIIIGGDGPKRALLEQVIAEAGLGGQVSMVGAVPHERVRDLLVQGQIFLNCSLTEAFCVALVEAAAAGLLVVSTRVGGVPEVLPEGMRVLAEPSPEGVIAALEEALARAARRGPSDAAAQHAAVAEMYSWPAVTARTERVYRDAMGCGRDDGAGARLRRFSLCGKWFGLLACAVAAVDWMYWHWLEWWEPASAVMRELDFPSEGRRDRDAATRRLLDKMQELYSSLFNLTSRRSISYTYIRIKRSFHRCLGPLGTMVKSTWGSTGLPGGGRRSISSTATPSTALAACQARHARPSITAE